MAVWSVEYYKGNNMNKRKVYSKRNITQFNVRHSDYDAFTIKEKVFNTIKNFQQFDEEIMPEKIHIKEYLKDRQMSHSSSPVELASHTFDVKEIIKKIKDYDVYSSSFPDDHD